MRARRPAHISVHRRLARSVNLCCELGERPLLLPCFHLNPCGAVVGVVGGTGVARGEEVAARGR